MSNLTSIGIVLAAVLAASAAFFLAMFSLGRLGRFLRQAEAEKEEESTHLFAVFPAAPHRHEAPDELSPVHAVVFQTHLRSSKHLSVLSC